MRVLIANWLIEQAKLSGYQSESGFCPSRQGERSFHWRIASAAHAVVLSEWHEVHGFGILYLSVIAGVTKRNVCA